MSTRVSNDALKPSRWVSITVKKDAACKRRANLSKGIEQRIYSSFTILETSHEHDVYPEHYFTQSQPSRIDTIPCKTTAALRANNSILTNSNPYGCIKD